MTQRAGKLLMGIAALPALWIGSHVMGPGSLSDTEMHSQVSATLAREVGAFRDGVVKTHTSGINEALDLGINEMIAATSAGWEDSHEARQNLFDSYRDGLKFGSENDIHAVEAHLAGMYSGVAAERVAMGLSSSEEIRGEISSFALRHSASESFNQDAFQAGFDRVGKQAVNARVSLGGPVHMAPLTSQTVAFEPSQMDALDTFMRSGEDRWTQAAIEVARTVDESPGMAKYVNPDQLSAGRSLTSSEPQGEVQDVTPQQLKRMAEVVRDHPGMEKYMNQEMLSQAREDLAIHDENVRRIADIVDDFPGMRKFINPEVLQNLDRAAKGSEREMVMPGDDPQRRAAARIAMIVEENPGMARFVNPDILEEGRGLIVPKDSLAADADRAADLREKREARSSGSLFEQMRRPMPVEDPFKVERSPDLDL